MTRGHGLAACALAVATAVWVLAAASQPALGFATNSFRFESMPVSWWYNPAEEPPPPPGTSWEELITLAAENWADVTCANVSFVYEGTTDSEWANDGVNAVFWSSDEWLWQQGAAAATLHIPKLEGQPREVDLALNGLEFIWTVGGGDVFQTNVLDAESVLTHELGHWLGLSHSADAFATMYQAKLIGTMQASLDADDKFGVCTLYPGGDDECAADADCPDGYECQAFEGLRVCGELRDPVGAHCSKDLLNCDGMCFITFWGCSAICAFTAVDYTAGYCARLCRNASGDEYACDPGYVCQEVPGYDIEACLLATESGEGSPEAVEQLPEGAEVVQVDVAPEQAEGDAELGAAEPDASGEGVGAAPSDAGCWAGTLPSRSWPGLVWIGALVSIGYAWRSRAAEADGAGNLGRAEDTRPRRWQQHPTR